MTDRLCVDLDKMHMKLNGVFFTRQEPALNSLKIKA